jgi:osmotically-inducible protein OsmY
VTLTGHVPTDADKERAESIARSASAGQVLADEIAVTPPHAESEANTVSSDLDKAIEKNVDAALVQNRVKTGISPKVTNGVVTVQGT